MKKLLGLVLLACAFAALPLQAVSVQTEEIGVNASEVPVLVKVSANLSFGNLIPTHLYSSQVKVEWALPNQALANIAESQVILDVKIEPRVNGSWIYFKKGGILTKSFYAQLYCVVENGACSNASKLLETATAYYQAPLDAQYPHPDGVKVSASIIPIAQAQKQAEFESKAIAQIASIESQLKGKQGNDAARLEQLLIAAKTLLAEKNFQELNETIASLEARIAGLGAARGQKDSQNTAAHADEKAPAENAANLPSQNQANETSNGTVEQKAASPLTGFLINSATAEAAGGVALVILALLGFAVTRKNKNNEFRRPTQASNSWEGSEEHAMGSGQAPSDGKPAYTPPSRERNTGGQQDGWPG